MNFTQVLEKLKLLSKVSEVESLTFGDETDLVLDLGIDSITIVEFIVFLEENGFVIDDEDLNEEHFSTVGSIKKYLSLRGQIVS